VDPAALYGVGVRHRRIVGEGRRDAVAEHPPGFRGAEGLLSPGRRPRVQDRGQIQRRPAAR
jgi:hypothetical protein